MLLRDADGIAAPSLGRGALHTRSGPTLLPSVVPSYTRGHACPNEGTCHEVQVDRGKNCALFSCGGGNIGYSQLSAKSGQYTEWIRTVEAVQGMCHTCSVLGTWHCTHWNPSP